MAVKCESTQRDLITEVNATGRQTWNSKEIPCIGGARLHGLDFGAEYTVRCVGVLQIKGRYEAPLKWSGCRLLLSGRMFEPVHNILSNIIADIRKYVVSWLIHLA